MSNKINIFELFAGRATVFQLRDRFWARRAILFVGKGAARAALTKDISRNKAAFSLVFSLRVIAAQYDIAIRTERVPTRVNPADEPFRAGELSLDAEPSDDLASLDALFPICDFSRALPQHANWGRPAAFTSRASQNCAMDAYNPKAWKLGQAEFPRRVLMRVGLEQARKESDADLKRLERLPQATDSAQAFDLIKAVATGAPPTTQAMAHDWGRANARRWLWASEAHKEAFDYNNENLLAAATMSAEEFEVSRSYPIHSVEEHIFRIPIAANDQVAG